MRLALTILKAPQTITFILLIIALLVGAGMSEYFLDAEYLLDQTSLSIRVGFMALAMTFVIIAGQIDLSVGSGALLVSVVAASAYANHWPMPVVILLAIVCGLLLGLFNGLLVAYLNLPSLVVTLGTLALYRGLAQGWIGDGKITGFPDWFTGIDYIKFFKTNVIYSEGKFQTIPALGGLVPLPLIVFLATSVIAGLVLVRTTFGRKVFAIGTNESAARYSAINTARVKLAVFVLSGLSMGIAALVEMSRIRTVDQKQFRSDELLAITAVVLGGTSIFGGRGSILGTVLALLLLVVVRCALGVAEVKIENQMAIIGSLLIASVLLTDMLGRIWVAERRTTGGTSHA
jgi:rhamnose transport system permease protein